MTRAALTLLALAACGDKDAHEHSGHDTANYEELTELTVGDTLVRWSSTPSPVPMNDYFTLTVELLDAADGTTPLTGLPVAVDAQMPAHGHGMTVAPVTTEDGEGRYTADPMLFHMEGHWQILVDWGDGDATFDFTCCD